MSDLHDVLELLFDGNELASDCGDKLGQLVVIAAKQEGSAVSSRVLARRVLAAIVDAGYGTDMTEAFRELRAAWFEELLAMWTLFEESDDDAIQRQNANTLLRAKYDQQTEAILLGKELAVAPRDEVDLDRKRMEGS